MPTSLPAFPVSAKEAIVNEYKASQKFGEVSIEFKFPKPTITSKMMPIEQGDSLLISCLSKNPLLIYKQRKLIIPAIEKNPMLPMKPIQKLQTMAESKNLLVLGHGERCLEFAKMDFEDDFVIRRLSQKSSSVAYSKLHFTTNDQLVSVGDNQLDFWDLQKQTRLGTMVGKGSVLDFDSCLQSSSIGAYCNGSLHVVDFSESWTTPVLLQKQSTSASILKWNPHVPYWIAAATASNLEIFDIRYNGRQPLLQIPSAGISQLCWSKNNCDLILTSSKDRRVNLWTLGQDTSYCRLNTMSLDYELASLCPDSLSNPNQFFGLDANDSLVKVQISREYLSKIAPCQSKNFESQEIEKVLYTRDSATLQQKLVEASKAETSSACFKQVKQLILQSMTSARSQVFDPKLVGSHKIDDSLSAFRELLQKSAAAAQQTFVRRKSEPGSKLQGLFETLRLKVRTSELIAAEDAVSLLKFSKTISEALQKDPEMLDQSQLIKLSVLLLKQSRSEALKFIQSIPNQPVLLWLSCYPTIFDTRSFECLGARMSLSRSIDDLSSEADQEEQIPVCSKLRLELFASLIKDPTIGPQTQKVIQQLSFTGVRALESTALKECILQEEEAALQAVVCVEPIKDLLEILIKQDSLIDFFAVAFRLHLLTSKTPFNSGLSEFISAVSFPRLKAHLKRAQAKPFTAGPSAIRTLLSVLADPFCAFGVDQMNVLAELFCELSVLLGSQCQELQNFYKTSPLVNQLLQRPNKCPPILLSELNKFKK